MSATATSAPTRERQTLDEHLAAEARHDPEASAATYVDDCWYENVAFGLHFEGRDQIALNYAGNWDLLPDMAAHHRWEQQFGDVIVQVGTITGTASSSVMGVPATGGPVELPFTAVITFRDGKMLGEHVWFDLDDLCRQAGVDADAVRDAVEATKAALGQSA